MKSLFKDLKEEGRQLEDLDYVKKRWEVQELRGCLLEDREGWTH